MSVSPDPERDLWRGPLIAVAIASGVGFVALAVAAAQSPLPIDLSVAGWLRPEDGPIWFLVDAINLVGQPAIWDALVVLIGLELFRRRRRLEAVILVVGVIAADAGASAAKIVIGRDRPPGIEVADLITQAGYPSGHMSRAVVTAGLLVLIAPHQWRRRAAAAGIALVILMGFARVASGDHWFTDVVGAVLYGVMAVSTIGVIGPLTRPTLERRFGEREGPDPPTGARDPGAPGTPDAAPPTPRGSGSKLG